MSTQVVAFTATSKPAKALRFFRDLIGLDLIDENDFSMLFGLEGTCVRVQKVGEVVVMPYTSVGFEVDEVTAEAQRLGAAGVEPLRYGHFEQDELGIWNAPGGAKILWVADPDGNVVSFSQLG